MSVVYKVVGVLLLVVALFVFPFQAGGPVGVMFEASLMSLFNLAVFVTAVISYIQFFIPGPIEKHSSEHNHIPFHIFNFLFVGLFFWISMNFLVANKQFFTGYENLSDADCIKQYYFGAGFSSLILLFIAFSAVINILYIITRILDHSIAVVSYSFNKKRMLAKA